MVGVPQLGLNELAQRVGLLLIETDLVTVAIDIVDECECLGIAVHVAVDGGTCVLLLAAAADALFHAVLHIALPIES